MLNYNQETKEKITIKYGDRQIRDLRLVVLKIWNSGNIPIVSTDFEKPLKFELQKPGELLEISVLQVSPAELQPTFSQSDLDLVIEPLLLNGGDKFELKILSTGFLGRFRISGRIAGIKEITEKSTIRRKNLLEYFWVRVVYIIGLLFSFS